jgi:hypothetical protein
MLNKQMNYSILTTHMLISSSCVDTAPHSAAQR